MNNVPIILLSAGASRRMGTPKQLLAWNGITLIEHQIQTLLKTGQKVYVVLGANASEILPFVRPHNVNSIIFEKWNSGMGNTIAFSIAYLQKNKDILDGVLIALVDQPLISVSHYNSLLKKFKPNLEQIVVSVSDKGWEGVPAIFHKSHFQELKNLKGEKGAKNIIKSLDKTVVKVKASNLLTDIDTPKVYQELSKQSNHQF